MSDPRVQGPLSAITAPIADAIAQHNALPPDLKNRARASGGAGLIAFCLYALIIAPRLVFSGLIVFVIWAGLAAFGALWLYVGVRASIGSRDIMTAFWSGVGILFFLSLMVFGAYLPHTLPRIDIAVDCGPTVNPDRVRAQFEGAVVMGLGVGLMNEISFKDGKVEQRNLDDYLVLRISDAPRETHVHIVPHGYDMPLGGVGEPGVPPVAPALMNAIFAASGRRIRALPLGQQLAKV
jgi:Molybdopterin-binding domain of aldehyde dehydrogenase